MGHMQFQVTGLRSSRQSKTPKSQRQSLFVIGALLAGAILAGRHSGLHGNPAISIAGTTEFGNQMVGTLSPLQSIAIQNSGSDALQLSSITVLTSEGSPSSDFIVSTATCAKARIEEGAPCQIGIRFHPKGVGVRYAMLVINDNATGSPQSYPLSGTGYLAPHADARSNPAEVDFGTRAVDGKYDSPLTVLNDGNAQLNITDIHFDGDAGPFSALSQNCNHATVQPTASCQMSVAFVPRQRGTYSASLSIDHGDAWPLTVPIRGVASGPRAGYCCIRGSIEKIDEDACGASGGIFLQDSSELIKGCRVSKRQLAAPVPIQPGAASTEQSQNLYPCNSVVFSWRPVDDPGEKVSYAVSVNAYSSMLAAARASPWQSFSGFSPTAATQLTLSNLLPAPNPRAAAVFRWQVVATDSLGNVSPPSDWRYFRCQVVIQ